MIDQSFPSKTETKALTASHVEPCVRVFTTTPEIVDLQIWTATEKQRRYSLARLDLSTALALRGALDEWISNQRNEDERGPIMAPTIHLNGTNGNDLRDENVAACAALRDALVAMRDAAPNARDYYVQGPNALQAAQVEHADRLLLVERALRDFELLVEAIVGQIDQRGARP